MYLPNLNKEVHTTEFNESHLKTSRDVQLGQNESRISVVLLNHLFKSFLKIMYLLYSLHPFLSFLRKLAVKKVISLLILGI